MEETNLFQNFNKTDIYKKQIDNICSNYKIKRDIEKEILYWKNNFPEMGLVLNGARQLGKTTLILSFCKKHFDQVFYINLRSDEGEFFLNKYKETNNTIEAIALTSKVYLEEPLLNSENTVIIIDEIQESKHTYEQLKNLIISLNCRIIFTGSYLGQLIDEKAFHSAGYTFALELQPLSFKEAYSYLKSKYSVEEYFDLYLTYGGYPAIVQKMRNDYTENDINLIFNNIIKIFVEESLDYVPVNFRSIYEKILNRMLSISAQKVVTHNYEVFEINLPIEENITKTNYEDLIYKAFNWLYGCKLTINVDPFPLTSKQIGKLQSKIKKVEKDKKLLLRFYFNDCGILNYLYNTSEQTSQRNIKGAILENFIYNELYKKQNEYKTFYSRFGDPEIDFILINNNNKEIIGLEIKNNLTNSKSLNSYVEADIFNNYFILTKNDILNYIKKSF